MEDDFKSKKKRGQKYICEKLIKNLALKLSVLLSSGDTTYLGYETRINTSWTFLERQYTIPESAVRVVLYVETPLTTADGGTGFHPDFAVDGFDANQIS